MGNIFNRSGQTYKRKRLRNNMTSAEVALWKYLRKRQILGYKFRRQYGIEEMIVDFYCPQLRLVIEVDGSVHDNDDMKKRDQEKELMINAMGIDIIRFKNNEVLTNINSVIKRIKQKTKNLSSPYDGEVPVGRRGAKRSSH